MRSSFHACVLAALAEFFIVIDFIGDITDERREVFESAALR